MPAQPQPFTTADEYDVAPAELRRNERRTLRELSKVTPACN